MTDKRFFTVAGPFTLGRLAELTGSELSDPAAAGASFVDVASLQNGAANTVSFFDNKKYADLFRVTRAGAVFVKPDFAPLAPAGTVALKSRNPYKAYALAAQAFYPAEALRGYEASTAVIDPSAKIGAECVIEHGVIIGRNVTIGSRCRIQAHAVIRDGVSIGDDADIGPNVVISHALIGNKVRIHPGAVIGGQGFGFARDPAGYVAVPQLGRVVIGDDVGIGANTTVDRGAGPDTEIGQGTRIDNLVQIGHNVKIGKYCVIVSQTGISGSTELGDYVMTGGQSGFAGHLKVGAGANIAAQSGIMRDIPPGEKVMGSPAVPIRQFLRQTALLSRMTKKRGDDE